MLKSSRVESSLSEAICRALLLSRQHSSVRATQRSRWALFRTCIDSRKHANQDDNIARRQSELCPRKRERGSVHSLCVCSLCSRCVVCHVSVQAKAIARRVQDFGKHARPSCSSSTAWFTVRSSCSSLFRSTFGCRWSLVAHQLLVWKQWKQCADVSRLDST